MDVPQVISAQSTTRVRRNSLVALKPVPSLSAVAVTIAKDHIAVLEYALTANVEHSASIIPTVRTMPSVLKWPDLPPRPTVCGAPQADCDPLETPNPCAAGTGCYLKTDGSTDCLTIQGNGQQGTECSNPEDCATGFVCTVAGEAGNTICATLCSTEEGNPAACGSTCPAETATKDLGNGYGACVPAGECGAT